MQEVNKMSVNYKDLKEEMRNDMVIDQWLKDGMISVRQRDSLKRYNRNLLKKMSSVEEM